MAHCLLVGEVRHNRAEKVVVDVGLAMMVGDRRRIVAVEEELVGFLQQDTVRLEGGRPRCCKGRWAVGVAVLPANRRLKWRALADWRRYFGDDAHFVVDIDFAVEVAIGFG